MNALERPLLTVFDRLRGRVPWEPLGDFPTPVEELARATSGLDGGPLFIKKDDLSSPVYGGNKVRTLEVLFGEAKKRGATRIDSTGAYGSNHATAALLHAPRAGLDGGAILFPQPPSYAAVENLRVILSTRPTLRALPHWSFLPLGMALQSAADRRAKARVFTMVPGGATPEGALGYVSAGLELAMQVERGEAPIPRTVVVAVGSTCTSAGLLVGMRVAAELGIGWKRAPRLVSVRVTPWPVTSAYRIVGLATRASALLASLTDDPRWRMSRRALAAGLEVDGRYLGWGYGRATPEGLAALHRLRETEGLELDTTYSAKAVASALARVRRGDPGPIVYWSTKSTAPLPVVTEDDWRWAPPAMVRWIEAAERAFPKP